MDVRLSFTLFLKNIWFIYEKDGGQKEVSKWIENQSKPNEGRHTHTPTGGQIDSNRTREDLADVAVCVRMSLCSSWASAEQQHRGQLKWGGEIKGNAGACSLCIQSPHSPTPQPACWWSCSERGHALRHSRTQVHRPRACAVALLRLLLYKIDDNTAISFLSPQQLSLYRHRSSHWF